MAADCPFADAEDSTAPNTANPKAAPTITNFRTVIATSFPATPSGTIFFCQTLVRPADDGNRVWLRSSVRRDMAVPITVQDEEIRFYQSSGRAVIDRLLMGRSLTRVRDRRQVERSRLADINLVSTSASAVMHEVRLQQPLSPGEVAFGLLRRLRLRGVRCREATQDQSRCERLTLSTPCKGPVSGELVDDGGPDSGLVDHDVVAAGDRLRNVLQASREMPRRCNEQRAGTELAALCR